MIFCTFTTAVAAKDEKTITDYRMPLHVAYYMTKSEDDRRFLEWLYECSSAVANTLETSKRKVFRAKNTNKNKDLHNTGVKKIKHRGKL